MLRAIYKHVRLFLEGNFTYLLISLILLFAFRPSAQSGVEYLGIWELLLGLVFFGSVFNINHPFKIKVIALCLNIPALLLDWTSFFHASHPLILVSIMLTILFLFLSISSMIYNEVLNVPATIASLRPIICAYFMLGFAFGYVYLLAEYFVPGSILLATPESTTSFFHLRYLSDVLYFSFGNLATVGAGSISAINTVTQTIAVMEAVLGQFYIAVLVARVVAIYSRRGLGKLKKEL